MCVLAALIPGFNRMIPRKLAPSVFAAFTIAARSLCGSCEGKRPGGHLKSLPVDSG
jgi:hypothetical protein